MTAIPSTVTNAEFLPDPRRVILKPFLPDVQIFPDGGLLDRVLALPEDDVESILATAYARFEHRHRDLDRVLDRHFQFVAGEAGGIPHVSKNRRMLIGAYYTSEFAIEGASLTNPSIVPAPDQSGLGEGEQRFIISLRAIGEGHVSAIEFRTGVIGVGGRITIAQPTGDASTGSREPPVFDKEVFSLQLKTMDAFDEVAATVMDACPDRFRLGQLQAIIADATSGPAPPRMSEPTIKAIHWLAQSNYEVIFPAESSLSERVIFPWSEVESHGLEDARFVRFIDDDGSVTYYATHTAYDGIRVMPQLIETTDFATFRIDTLSGAFAQSKGAALFPRKVGGNYAALSRFDGENNYVMSSDRLRIWESAERIESPERPWELARIGNCGSPLETAAGWLVITHGVGPFRTYSLGAILLDLEDPTRVIGQLDEPLLGPAEAQRDGYVPNVVYSCGSMIHNGELVLPYGRTDRTAAITTFRLDDLLARLTG
jgi:predicted GH43/DUF377 family glycosyl hydrolase